MPLVYRNTLLQSLDPESIERLCLIAVDLPVRSLIEGIGTKIQHLVFLDDGVASMTASFLDGAEVELSVLGCRSVLGASALLGTRRSLNNVYMQIAGRGYKSPSTNAIQEFERHGQFHDLALRSNQAHFVQTAQTAGCNARHTVEQRLARWLLLCFDLMEKPTIKLPHEHIAALLGCNRSTVTVAAGNLQRRGQIKYSRSKILLLDRPGLESSSCECYRTLFNYLNDREDFDGKDPGGQSALARSSHDSDKPGKVFNRLKSQRP